ncbi:MAG: hypothetical protein ACREDQ_12265 [Limisphaerales bacterium]
MVVIGFRIPILSLNKCGEERAALSVNSLTTPLEAVARAIREAKHARLAALTAVLKTQDQRLLPPGLANENLSVNFPQV